MVLIAQNHLQFIIEVGLMTLVGVMLLLNIVPISLSMVLFVMLILAVGITLLFGFDAVSLLLLHNAYEFTHFLVRLLYLQL